jgi:hypothetical protein
LFLRALISFKGNLPALPNCFQKTPTPITLPLWLVFNMWILRGHKHSEYSHHLLFAFLYSLWVWLGLF